MGEYICECQLCHVRDIKRSELEDGVDYIHKGNRYYHKKCYENWKKSTPATDEEYKAFIYDFLSRDLKVSYNFHMCKAQIEKFVKEGKTVKGIFFALKYFYEVKNNDWEKGHGGLGIVPYIYNESCEYWAAQEHRTKGIVSQIEQQMKVAAERNKKVIEKKEVKPKKFTVDFSILDDLEDEE